MDDTFQDPGIEITRQFGPSNSAPTTLHCMITSRCSMNCPGCYYRDPGETGEWTREYAWDIVDSAAALGVQWLAIGGGEPTEVEWLGDMIYRAQQQGMKVAMTTNGVNLVEVFPNRVHVSHDSIHTRGSGLSWDDREAQVWDAVQHYQKIARCATGLNTLWPDLDRLDNWLCQIVDCVTALLPKPFIPEPGWKSKLNRMLKDREEWTHTCVDGCLAGLMFGACSQGRISMALDQRGMAGVCSNIRDVRIAPGIPLKGQWDYLRAKDHGTWPRGCIVGKLEASVAQPVEQVTRNDQVVGSTPTAGSMGV